MGTSAGKSLRRTKTSKLYILAMVSPENSSYKKVASVREQKISSKILRDRKIIQLILHSVCQYDNFSQHHSISEPVVVNAFFFFFTSNTVIGLIKKKKKKETFH